MARTKGVARKRTTPPTDFVLGPYDLAEGDTVIGRFLLDRGSDVKWYFGVLSFNTGPEFRQCTYAIHYCDGEVKMYTAELMYDMLRAGYIRKAVPDGGGAAAATAAATPKATKAAKVLGGPERKSAGGGRAARAVRRGCATAQGAS